MLSNKSLVAACAVGFCCNVTFLVLFVKYNSGEKCFITINELQNVTYIMPEQFLSIGIDASEIERHKAINFTNFRIRQLARALAPARLRFGGTMSDRLIFSKNEVHAPTCDKCSENVHSNPLCSAYIKLCKQHALPLVVMTGKEWTEINEFCKGAKLRLLFTFNVLLRDEKQGWDDHNAKELLEYTKHKKYELDFQLGNEPNSFKHVFNINLTAVDLAGDFGKLRKLLNHSGFKNSSLVGPDTTRPQYQHPSSLEYMREFLKSGIKYISAVSWHQYYLNSKTATLEDFWNPDTFDLLKTQIETMRNHTKKYRHMPMWLTETSSAYGGGAEGLSNTYAGSPLWLDKLGLAAKYNITTVVRQSFIGGNYSLIDANLEPLPDWWISVLFKKLIGNKILHIDCNCSRYQRMYAHCANRNYTNDTTAITIYAINLDREKARFLLNGTALHGNNLLIDEYILSAPSNNRKSKTLWLNGWPLYYEDSMPPLEPIHLKYGNHISMPPYSMAFWVIKNTSIKVCK